MVSIAALQAERLTSAMCCPRSARHLPHWDLKQRKVLRHNKSLLFLALQSQIPPEKSTQVSDFVLKGEMRTVELPLPHIFLLQINCCPLLFTNLIGDPTSTPEPKCSVSRIFNPPTAFVQIHSSFFFPSSRSLSKVGCSKSQRSKAQMSPRPGVQK